MVATVGSIWIVTARIYAVKMHLGPDKWLELTPPPVQVAPPSPSGTRAGRPSLARATVAEVDHAGRVGRLREHVEEGAGALVQGRVDRGVQGRTKSIVGVHAVELGGDRRGARGSLVLALYTWPRTVD